MTYTWNGPAGKDAMKKRRTQKREEAEARQAAYDAKRGVVSLSEADKEAIRNDTDAPVAQVSEDVPQGRLV